MLNKKAPFNFEGGFLFEKHPWWHSFNFAGYVYAEKVFGSAFFKG